MRTYLSEDQVKKQKIIIWGYPLYSHTHSYIHSAFFKAFSYLGYETYWFDDGNFPKDFDYDHCIFWTEGFADKNIPLRKTSVYYVHVCPDPMKYILAEVKDFIDVRYNHIWHDDHVYKYVLNKKSVEKIGPSCYFEEAGQGSSLLKNDYVNYEIPNYRKIYITWATNVLPSEFNFEDINHPRENKIWFSGTLSKKGRNENFSVYRPFIKQCKKYGIAFVHNNPFINPLTDEEVIRRTKKSFLGVDLRGPEHVKNGYVPCRVFKSISWGHLGMTNSNEVFQELDGNVLYRRDPEILFDDALTGRSNKQFIKNSMLYVKENHTYLNRVDSILSIL
jgi:hypothetical protein